MKFLSLALLAVTFAMTFTITTTEEVQARKPAVEDFVGVEPESYRETPKGTEVLHNFGNHIKATQGQKIDSTPDSEQWNNWFGFVAVGAFLSLPFLVWFGITHSKTYKTNTAVATHTPVSDTTGLTTQENVANLSDYRKDGDDPETGKKAS